MHPEEEVNVSIDTRLSGWLAGCRSVSPYLYSITLSDTSTVVCGRCSSRYFVPDLRKTRRKTTYFNPFNMKPMVKLAPKVDTGMLVLMCSQNTLNILVLLTHHQVALISKLKFMKENYGHIELLHNVESQWCHI